MPPRNDVELNSSVSDDSIKTNQIKQCIAWNSVVVKHSYLTTRELQKSISKTNLADIEWLIYVYCYQKLKRARWRLPFHADGSTNDDNNADDQSNNSNGHCDQHWKHWWSVADIFHKMHEPIKSLVKMAAFHW